jgi:endonuclease/exonuclease/phosphatase family metal-dependent hydrolase
MQILDLTMTTFRIATLNVHSFGNPSTYTNNLEELVSILQPYNLDLIAVQEISNGENWRKFCKLLSLPYYVYGEADRHYLGNGIASRYPIKSHRNQISEFSYTGGTRSLLQCCLDDDDQSFVKDRIFAVTHLDHFDENDRLAQIKEFHPLEKNIDILMGDMNALMREDYSDDYYEKYIVQIREKSRWEKPCFDLTNFITKQWNFQDAFKQINPQFKDQQVITCRFKTRIDYIYLRPRINDS